MKKENFYPEMTRFQALFVCYLRCRIEGTWRYVAGKWYIRYTDKKPFNYDSTWGGNQLDGMFLFTRASEILGFNVD